MQEVFVLILFKVRNYTSFKEESILDLRAAPYVQYETHCVKINEKNKLLKTCAIYGANASGKSNFISAMFFFKQYIFSQFMNNGNVNDSFDNDQMPKTAVNLEPFLLSNTENDASEFEIIITKNGSQIQYGFECTTKKVINEWYYINDEKVYERKESSLSFGINYKKILNAYKKVPEERLYLSILEYFLSAEQKDIIIGDFYNFFTKEYIVYFEILIESIVKGVYDEAGFIKKLINDKTLRDKVSHYLHCIDVGVKKLDVHDEITINKRTGKSRNTKIIRTVHDVYDENGMIIGEKYFDLLQESSGTLRFLAFIQHVIEMLDNGGVFIVDELSSRLHPKLTKLIVDIFQSDINKKAQLIFTTHDISLLNHEQFRRDEIAFIDKNDRGESKIYALSDLRVREDSTFSKDYMQGKYGAVPMLKYDYLLGGE